MRVRKGRKQQVCRKGGRKGGREGALRRTSRFHKEKASDLSILIPPAPSSPPSLPPSLSLYTYNSPLGDRGQGRRQQSLLAQMGREIPVHRAREGGREGGREGEVDDGG